MSWLLYALPAVLLVAFWLAWAVARAPMFDEDVALYGCDRSQRSRGTDG